MKKISIMTLVVILTSLIIFDVKKAIIYLFILLIGLLISSMIIKKKKKNYENDLLVNQLIKYAYNFYQSGQNDNYIKLSLQMIEYDKIINVEECCSEKEILDKIDTHFNNQYFTMFKNIVSIENRKRDKVKALQFLNRELDILYSDHIKIGYDINFMKLELLFYSFDFAVVLISLVFKDLFFTLTNNSVFIILLSVIIIIQPFCLLLLKNDFYLFRKNKLDNLYKFFFDFLLLMNIMTPFSALESCYKKQEKSSDEIKMLINGLDLNDFTDYQNIMKKTTIIKKDILLYLYRLSFTNYCHDNDRYDGLNLLNLIENQLTISHKFFIKIEYIYYLIIFVIVICSIYLSISNIGVIL